MKIEKVTYIENGYFSIKYNKSGLEVIQDIGAIKMTVPTSPIIKDILVFLRKLKLEKLNTQDFDELKYRDLIIYEGKPDEDYLKMIRAMTNIE